MVPGDDPMVVAILGGPSLSTCSAVSVLKSQACASQIIVLNACDDLVNDDNNTKPYVRNDTWFYCWVGYPPVTGTEIMVTIEEFPTYSRTDLTNVKDMEYVHYGIKGENTFPM